MRANLTPELNLGKTAATRLEDLQPVIAEREKFDSGFVPQAKFRVEFSLPPGQYLNIHQIKTMTATLQKQIIDINTAPQLEEKVLRFMKNGWLKIHVITKHKSGNYIMSTYPKGPMNILLPDDYVFDTADHENIDVAKRLEVIKAEKNHEQTS